MIRTVKYFRESSFGPMTIHTGKMGSGLTLGAVIRIVQASKSKSPPVIVANCTLKGLHYEHITPEDFVVNMERYLAGNYLLLLDSGYSYFSSRANISRALVHFFKLLGHSKSKAILTTSMGLQVIDKGIRGQVTDMVSIYSKFPKSQKVSLIHYRLSTRIIWAENEDTRKMERLEQFYWKPISRCIVKRSGRYWRYYISTEVTGVLGRK